VRIELTERITSRVGVLTGEVEALAGLQVKLGRAGLQLVPAIQPGQVFAICR